MNEEDKNHLRDLFAALAMHSLVGKSKTLPSAELAAKAYELADCMIEVRSDSEQ